MKIQPVENLGSLLQGVGSKIGSLVSAVLALVVVASLSLAYYFYTQFNELKQNPQRLAQEEVQQLISRVGQLIVLPGGEQPTVATVNDPERLKNQPFFANAKVGYKVLIYTNAKKAILYDPVENRIVEVAPVNIGAPETTSPTLEETKE